MNKDVIKAIPDCIEKIGRFTPAKHREFRKSMIYALPFSILGGTIYCIHKERMIDKKYKHEETMLQIEYAHKEKIEEIKANLLIRAEERKHEKDN